MQHNTTADCLNIQASDGQIQERPVVELERTSCVVSGCPITMLGTDRITRRDCAVHCVYQSCCVPGAGCSFQLFQDRFVCVRKRPGGARGSKKVAEPLPPISFRKAQLQKGFIVASEVVQHSLIVTAITIKP